MRFLAGATVVAAIVGLGWVFSLPSRTECVASGRVVDPTERHCRHAGGYQQLQEHALFHAREAVAGTAIVWAGALAVYRFRRRRASTSRAA